MSALISTWLKTLVVHSHHGSDHLGKDDHVAKVSLDALWLLAVLWPGDGLLGSPQALEKRVVLAFEAVLETATGASVDELHEVSHGHDEGVLEVDSTVGVLTEGLLLRGGVSHVVGLWSPH